MNYLRLTILALSSGLMSINVMAQPMDLLDAYNEAVQRDPLIASAKFLAQTGKEKRVQGKSLLLPRLTIGGDVGYGYQRSVFDVSETRDSQNNVVTPAGEQTFSGKSESYGVNAELTQPIYRAADRSAFEQSKLAETQSDIELAIAEQDLILRVSQSYFDVLSAQENLAVSEAQTRAFDESLERAKLTFKVGTATKTDKLEAQARFDIAAASEIAAKNQLAIANQTLASIIGQVPDSLKKPAQNTDLSDVDPTDMKYWVDTALGNNLNLKLANLGVDISKIEVKRLKGDRLPTVNFIATASNGKSYSAFSDRDTKNTNLSAVIRVAMPIYTGGLMASRIREAEFLRLQQNQIKIDSNRQVQLQTQQAYLNALNGNQQVKALRQAMISSESALEATKKGVEVGVRTNLDLLDAQQLYFGTQRDFSVAKYEYLVTLMQLKAAAGVLSETDVKALNSLLTTI